MLTFLQFLAEQYLEEKLILYNQGKRYGQVVFLAGGAGSGKGFAIRNFMEKEKFKVRDVDEWKRAFMKMADLQGKYPEIKGLNLKNSKDVAKIHAFVKKMGMLTAQNVIGALSGTQMPSCLNPEASKGA